MLFGPLVDSDGKFVRELEKAKDKNTQIKHRYHQLALTFHPDKCKQSSFTELCNKAFLNLESAKETLLKNTIRPAVRCVRKSVSWNLGGSEEPQTDQATIRSLAFVGIGCGVSTLFLIYHLIRQKCQRPVAGPAAPGVGLVLPVIPLVLPGAEAGGQFERSNEVDGPQS